MTTQLNSMDAFIMVQKIAIIHAIFEMKVLRWKLFTSHSGVMICDIRCEDDKIQEIVRKYFTPERISF